MLHSRWMPSIDPAQPAALDELVTMQSVGRGARPGLHRGRDVELFDVPGDELSALRPYEMIAGYWRQVGATFAGGERRPSVR